MTKKDYERIAKVFVGLGIAGKGDIDVINWAHTAGIREVAIELSYVFEQDNPRFDRAKFLRACGL